jgi:AAA+ superfamily predicted ATPase
MPVNGSVAPVCPISRSQAPSAQPASPVAIPRPTDLPSAINAINQLITMLNPLVINNLGFPYVPQWQEVKRNVQTVRIFNPNDREQWVDVERITNLVFQDQSTDALFQWNYKLPKGTLITPNR